MSRALYIIHSFKRVEDYWELLDRLQKLEYYAEGFCVTDNNIWSDSDLIFIDVDRRTYCTIKESYYYRYLASEHSLSEYDPETSIFNQPYK